MARSVRVSRRRFVAFGSASLCSSFVPILPAAPNPRRRLYLRRLARSVRETLAANEPLTERQRFLAGLTAIERLYVIDDDLVLEGPAADSWSVHHGHTALEARHNRPLLALDDLVVALRNVYSDAPAPMLSLEPRRASLAAVQEVLKRFGIPKNPAQTRQLRQQIQQVWGPQDAVLQGVPRQSRFALVMAYADWEMKRLSLGLRELPGLDLTPYIDLEFADYVAAVRRIGPRARPPALGSRFWFMAADEPFERTEDNQAFQFPAHPVRLVTEGYFRSKTYARIDVAPTPAAERYAAAFTQHYDAIAARFPLYHDLRNLFHLVGLAKLLRRFDLPRRVGWDLQYLLEQYPLQRVPAPETMAGLTAIRSTTVKLRDGEFTARLFLPAWGGVYIDPPVA